MQQSVRLFLGRDGLKRLNCTSVTRYSSRSNSDTSDAYKVIKPRRSAEEIDDSQVPNWELLAPRGYRFYLPGGLGPAWYDSTSTPLPYGAIAQTPVTDSKFDFTVQRCPVLLRKDVEELFTGVNFRGLELSVVTLTYHRAKKRTLGGNVTADPEGERETVVKSFVVVAQEVCTKLKMAGYWADFVNPFSGRPYFGTGFELGGMLYRVDPRFRCLGFRVIDAPTGCSILAHSAQAPLTGMTTNKLSVHMNGQNTSGPPCC
ncbi:methylmalonic aciduria and homocystinuria type D homolog, mitochondrial-like isoform X2 [Schistocerca nitens]|uniref:methylmalonic aciduria and homocystinuria type D homolog, mitochondrial-like isoform X2 n=1 Tax=Schistocerca nitens TaxID=7011 RepID=UPI002118B130|nr:methylmalonic aciduria and homocystinuria type D homolog, mitochondrial-like isoform X2 [Schistocerca nitens]